MEYNSYSTRPLGQETDWRQLPSFKDFLNSTKPESSSDVSETRRSSTASGSNAYSVHTPSSSGLVYSLPHDGGASEDSEGVFHRESKASFAGDPFSEYGQPSRRPSYVDFSSFLETDSPPSAIFTSKLHLAGQPANTSQPPYYNTPPPSTNRHSEIHSVYTGQRPPELHSTASHSYPQPSHTTHPRQFVTPQYSSLPQQSLSTSPRVSTGPGSTIPLDGRKRHKISEKHRRDGQGIYINCSDIIRSGLTLYDCPICPPSTPPASSTTLYPTQPFFLPPASSNAPTPYQSSMAPSTAPSGASTPTTAGSAKPKKAKNDQLAEGFMWEFLLVLHLRPEELPERMHRIRALAEQVAREKESGMVGSSFPGSGSRADTDGNRRQGNGSGRDTSAQAQGEWKKRKAWEDDVRDKVAGEVLRRMVEECERHGVDPWGLDGGGRSAVGNGRADDALKRMERNRAGGGRQSGLPTPPRMVGSPQYAAV